MESLASIGLNSEIYDLWVSTGTLFGAARDFYARLVQVASGPVAVLEEGGAVLGRHVARSGREVTVITEHGNPLATDTLAPLNCDWPDFTLPAPASLVMAPFGALDHVCGEERRRKLFSNAFDALGPGGRFVFDLRLWSGKICREFEGMPRMVTDAPLADGRRRIIWETWRSEKFSRRVRCRLGVEELDPGGRVAGKTYRDLTLGRVGPDEVRALALETGFTVDGSFGGFEMEPLTGQSASQVWILRRPAGRR